MQIRKILYPTDFSEANRPVLTFASALARENRAEMLIMHVYQPPLPPATLGGATAAILRPPIEDARHRLFEVRPTDASIRHQHRLMEGLPSAAILKTAQDEAADLIIMGTHGRAALSRLLLGSVAEAVVREAPCPVITLKRSEEVEASAHVGKILFPTDLSPRSNAAIAFASSLARDFDAELILLHVQQTTLGYGGGDMHFDVTIPTTDELIAQLDQVSPPHSGVPCSRRVLTGDPATTIEELARKEGVELIAMATHGRTGLQRALMGSVAEAVVRRAARPVLTVRLSTLEDSERGPHQGESSPARGTE